MTVDTEKQGLKPTTVANNSRKKKSKILAILLAILFVFVAVIGAVGYDVWRVLFDPPRVKQVLTDEIIHSDIVPAVLEAFSENRAQQRIAKGEALSGVTEPDIVLLMSYLNADNWREIKEIMLSDEFVSHLVSVSVDGIFSWIDSSDLWPIVVWDMSTLKTRLVGKEGEQAILVAYGAMPECTEADITDFKTRLAAVPPGVEVLYNLCQFPDPWHNDQVGDYVNSLIDVNQNIPTQYNFSQMLSVGQTTSQANPELLKIQLRGLRQFTQWSWLVALILLLLVILLAVRSLRSLGKFVGIPLVVIGLIVLLIRFIAQPFLTNLITGSLMTNASPFLRQEIGSSVGHLTGEIFQPMLLQGGIILIIGAVLIVFMIVKKSKPLPAEKA